MNKEIEIGKKDESGKEEWYCMWYICPNCKAGDNEYYSSGHIYIDFKFCPDCGIKLKWKFNF
jgi:hypothetical protein